MYRTFKKNTVIRKEEGQTFAIFLLVRYCFEMLLPGCPMWDYRLVDDQLFDMISIEQRNNEA
jgi:hypothetical protein